MKIQIDGKHLSLGESLKTHINQYITHTTHKYFKNPINAHVIVEKDNYLFKTEIIVNEGTGKKALIKSTAEDYDPYKSFNDANEKINKQLRRYKSKITHHQKH